MEKNQLKERKIRVPQVHLPLHKQRLKRMLLATPPSFHRPSLFFFFTFFMKTWKKFAVTGMAVFTFALGYQIFHGPDLPGAIERVSARERVADATVKLKQLSPGELDALQAQIGDEDLFKTLKDAYEAKDLKDCAYDPCELLKSVSISENNMTINMSDTSTSAQMGEAKVIAQGNTFLQELHYIEYSTNEGTFLIGLDQQNLPHLVVSTLTSPPLLKLDDKALMSGDHIETEAAPQMGGGSL